MDTLPPPVEGGSPMVLGSLDGIKNSNAELILKAAKAGNKKALRKLKDKGAIDNVDVKNSVGQTALFIACFEEHDDCVIFLLELGANANEPSDNGQTPLHAACYKGSIKAVSALIEHGGDFRFHDKDQRTAKDWAMMNTNPKKRQPMIEYIVKTRMFAMTNSGRDVLLERQDSLYLRRPTAESGSLAKLFSLRRGSRRDSTGVAKVTSFMSLGYGKVYGGTKGGTVSFVPVVAEAMLRHDEHATTFVNGAFFVMESMTLGHTRVTVKRLHHNPPKGGIVDHLIMECDNIAHLRHPNVLLLMATCYTDNMEGLVLVFERIQFGSLYSYLHDRSQQPQPSAAIEASLQIAEGLIYIHQSGFLHCGLTSHAMFLTNPNTVKIGNFEYMVPMSSSGLALRHSGVTQNKYLHAVYNWLAPEVINGELPSEKSDLYSFCCIMWEIFTAFIPWSGHDSDQVTQQVCQGKKMLCVNDPRVPAKLSDVLMYGLQPNPANRKMSLQHVRDVLYLLPRGKYRQGHGRSSKPNMQPSSSAAHINNHCSSGISFADFTIERYEYVSTQSRSEHEQRSPWESCASPIVRFQFDDVDPVAENLSDCDYATIRSRTAASLGERPGAHRMSSLKPETSTPPDRERWGSPGECSGLQENRQQSVNGLGSRYGDNLCQLDVLEPDVSRRFKSVSHRGGIAVDGAAAELLNVDQMNESTCSLHHRQIDEEAESMLAGMLQLCANEQALIQQQTPEIRRSAPSGTGRSSSAGVRSENSYLSYRDLSHCSHCPLRITDRQAGLSSNTEVAHNQQHLRSTNDMNLTQPECHSETLQSSAARVVRKAAAPQLHYPHCRVLCHPKHGNISGTSLYDSEAIKPASHSTKKDTLPRLVLAEAPVVGTVGDRSPTDRMPESAVTFQEPPTICQHNGPCGLSEGGTAYARAACKPDQYGAKTGDPSSTFEPTAIGSYRASDNQLHMKQQPSAVQLASQSSEAAAMCRLVQRQQQAGHAVPVDDRQLAAAAVAAERDQQCGSNTWKATGGALLSNHKLGTKNWPGIRTVPPTPQQHESAKPSEMIGRRTAADMASGAADCRGAGSSASNATLPIWHSSNSSNSKSFGCSRTGSGMPATCSDRSICSTGCQTLPLTKPRMRSTATSPNCPSTIGLSGPGEAAASDTSRGLPRPANFLQQRHAASQQAGVGASGSTSESPVEGKWQQQVSGRHGIRYASTAACDGQDGVQLLSATEMAAQGSSSLKTAAAATTRDTCTSEQVSTNCLLQAESSSQDSGHRLEPLASETALIQAGVPPAVLHRAAATSTAVEEQSEQVPYTTFGLVTWACCADDNVGSCSTAVSLACEDIVQIVAAAPDTTMEHHGSDVTVNMSSISDNRHVLTRSASIRESSRRALSATAAAAAAAEGTSMVDGACCIDASAVADAVVAPLSLPASSSSSRGCIDQASVYATPAESPREAADFQASVALMLNTAAGELQGTSATGGNGRKVQPALDPAAARVDGAVGQTAGSCSLKCDNSDLITSVSSWTNTSAGGTLGFGVSAALATGSAVAEIPTGCLSEWQGSAAAGGMPNDCVPDRPSTVPLEPRDDRVGASALTAQASRGLAAERPMSADDEPVATEAPTEASTALVTLSSPAGAGSTRIPSKVVRLFIIQGGKFIEVEPWTPPVPAAIAHPTCKLQSVEGDSTTNCAAQLADSIVASADVSLNNSVAAAGSTEDSSPMFQRQTSCPAHQLTNEEQEQTSESEDEYLDLPCLAK